MNTQTSDSAHLLGRIERLERAYGRWRLAALVAGLGIIGTAAIAAAQTQQTALPTLKASGFVLVDHEGRELAELGFADGMPALSFFDGVRHPLTKLNSLSLEIGTAP